jgi:hypothetical protein
MPNGDLWLDFGDDRQKFNLTRVKHVLELEELCGAGIAKIFKRLRESDYGIRDVREPIRLGLIGGGNGDEKALSLTRRYCDEREDGLSGAVPIATAVLLSVLVGVPEDNPPGKPPADRAGSNPSSEASSSDSASS